jgi:parallel beta-helix repeat protein
VVLDFSLQTTGNANGFSARGVQDLVLESFTVRDSKGDGIRVQDSKNVTFRNLDVHWTAGAATDNGAYGLYPVHDENVLIEDCSVKGASDAGIYVGQSNHTLVRRSHVESNVTGIEIENTDDAEVVDNVAIDNVSGILVFNLPNLVSKTGARTKVHKNRIEANNRMPFAMAGSIVSYVPAGTGMILFANDRTEVHENTFTGNASTAIVVVSCMTVQFLTDGAVNCNDPLYDSFPEGVSIHDNTITGNGTAPIGFYGIYWRDHSKPFFDIIWDGVVDPNKPNTDGSLSLCIKGNAGATFARINPTMPGTVDSTDLAAHDCTHAALPGVSVTW